MEKLGSIIFSSRRKAQETPIPMEASPTIAISHKIKTTKENIGQYARTIKAFLDAHMPFEIIAKAAMSLGDKVESLKHNVHMRREWRNNTSGEFIERQDMVLAWQDMGEIEVTPQLPSIPNKFIQAFEDQPASSLDPFPGVKQAAQQKTNVLDGIAVFNREPQPLPDSQTNSQLENNPYLRAPANLA